MSESIRIQKWIVSKLNSDTAANTIISGRVYSRITAKSTFPLVTFGLHSGRDVNGNAGVRLMTTPLYRIKAINKGGLTANFITLVDRLDDIFQTARNDIFEGYSFSSVRVQEIEQVEEGDSGSDVYYTHKGGLYRIDCYKV